MLTSIDLLDVDQAASTATDLVPGPQHDQVQCLKSGDVRGRKGKGYLYRWPSLENRELLTQFCCSLSWNFTGLDMCLGALRMLRISLSKLSRGPVPVTRFCKTAQVAGAAWCASCKKVTRMITCSPFYSQRNSACARRYLMNGVSNSFLGARISCCTWRCAAVCGELPGA